MPFHSFGIHKRVASKNTTFPFGEKHQLSLFPELFSEFSDLTVYLFVHIT